jgi:hypothetical protein
MAANFDIGDLVTFNYSGGTDVHDQHPVVLCLHNDWLCHTPRGMTGVGALHREFAGGKRCVHGLNWNNLDEKERTYLRAVMNPKYEMDMRKKDDEFAKKMSDIHKIRDLDIQSPEDFYKRLIRPFIKPKGWEPYRRYRVDKIRGPRILMSKELLSGAVGDTTFRRIMRRLSAMRGRR